MGRDQRSRQINGVDGVICAFNAGEVADLARRMDVRG